MWLAQPDSRKFCLELQDQFKYSNFLCEESMKCFWSHRLKNVREDRNVTQN